jgi:small subunit ribosomal protein S21
VKHGVNVNKEYNNKRRDRDNLKQPGKVGDNKAVAVNDKYAHIEAIQAQPLEVKVINSNFDKALRAFRALVQKERVLSTYKENQFYEKPSDKRRRKKNEANRKRLELTNVDAKERGTKKFKHRRHSASNDITE